MLFKIFNKLLTNPSRKITLKTILTVPFLLQIFTTVGLVGYLSWRNGNQAVNDVASQLRSEVTDRVQQHLEDYLEQPHLIIELNQKAAKLGQIGFNDFTFAEKYFWEQIQIFDAVRSIYMGNPQGKFVYIKREKERFFAKPVQQVPARREYALDSQGSKTELIKVDEYDPRPRPWYQKTLESNKNNWSEVYTFTGGELGITAAGALYNSSGKFIGVTGVDFILTFINKFLGSIDISPHGQAFIIERDGFLVASSSQEKPFTRDKYSSKEQRFKAIASSNLLTKSTTKYLFDYFGKLDKIQTSQQLEYFIDGQRQFVQVLPYQDNLGLDWVIVVVVPEADFMGQINANTRNTIILCLVALGLATLLGIITAHRIAKPVDILSRASAEIARGNWQQKVDVKHIHELKLLGESFNSMANQLQISFQTLEAKEKHFRTLVGNIPGAIYRCQWDKNWTMEFISDAIANISGYPAREFIDNQTRSYASIIHPADDRLVRETIKAAIAKKEPYNIEYRIMHQDRNVRWVYEQGIGVFDRQDNFLYLDGAIFDISDRKQAQEDLRIAEENYRSIFENALEGIFQSTSEGKFISVNPAMAKIYGYQSAEEMISSIEDIGRQTYVNPQDRIEIGHILAEKGKVRNFEYQIYKKDGSKIWLEEDSRVVRDSQGKLLYYEGIVRNISERKQVEQQLKQQLKDLKIEIDQNKRAKEVAKITQSDYFQELQAEAESLRFDDDW